MKKIVKIISLCLLVFTITGCSSNIKEISISSLQEKLNNKESFILEIKQDGCINCEKFNPKFEKILKENKINAYSVNLTNLSDIELETFKGLYNYTGTPTVIFIKDGIEKAIHTRIVGNVEREYIVKKLKDAGYIK